MDHWQTKMLEMMELRKKELEQERQWMIDCINKRRQVGQTMGQPKGEKVGQVEQPKMNDRNDDRNNNPDNDCTICMEKPINSVIIPCGHLCCCYKCGKELASCPICRANIEKIVKTFKV